MNFKKTSANNYCVSNKNNLDNFILSQPCGYISHFCTDNYSPVSLITVIDKMEETDYGSKKN